MGLPRGKPFFCKFKINFKTNKNEKIINLIFYCHLQL